MDWRPSWVRRFRISGPWRLAVILWAEGGMVTITARQIGLEVEILVRDTGIGIPPEDHHRIFEAYQQAGTPSARQKGTGLGLAITKRLAELHGGSIRVESAPGQGSSGPNIWRSLAMRRAVVAFR